MAWCAGLRLGAGGAVKAYWNGQQVFRDPAYRQPVRDRASAMVEARTGHNHLLIKVCVTDTRWGFYARIGDAKGGPAKGLRFEAEPATKPVIEPAHVEMIHLARAVGAAANYSGSGGAVTVVAPDASTFERARRELAGAGCSIVEA